MEITHHIESAQWLDQAEFAIEIAGWCFVSGEETTAIEAQVGGRRIALAATEPRPDVQEHHSGNRHALRSGFRILLPLLELETIVELRAVFGAYSEKFYSIRVGDLPNRGPIIIGYPAWTAAQKKSAAMSPRPTQLPGSASGPLVSILLPVFNTPARFLAEAIDSVLQQTYSNWELRIVDDGSSQAETRDLLAQIAPTDWRIHLHTLPKNSGISHATNQALHEARGDYVGFIDHDDRLHPSALAEVVEHLARTGADAVYTDEEKITADGMPCAGIFKPDFSPEFLCGVMYIGHFLCVKTSVARKIGGLDPRFDGVQDFEFALRLSEQTPHIEHLSKILYQWRMSPSSSAQSGNVKGDMDRLQLEAVQQHLERTGRRASAKSLGAHRIQLLPIPRLHQGRDALVLRDEAWREKIPSAEAFAVTVLADASVENLVRTLRNRACERLVWINEPIAVPSLEEIAALLGFLDDPTVGGVAPTLLAKDGKVFSSGLIITPSRKIVPAMRGFSIRGDGYNGSLACNREVSATLPTCVAFRRSDLLACLSPVAHPFSESAMAELCVRLHQQRLRILVCAGIQVKTDRDWAGQDCLGEIRSEWVDSYFNTHFDAEKGDYRLG